MFYVMNHYSRSPEFVTRQLDAEGVDYTVNTDYSDYRKTRNNERYRGVVENYISCLADSPDLEWRIIFHDDIIIPPGAIKKMLYVLGQSPKTGISFYNPTNKGYSDASEKGHHVMRTYGNYWCQAFAWPKEYTDKFLNWVFVNGQPYGPVAEDQLVWQWSAETDNPMHSIIPSLAQHHGYDRSTFGNPPRAGKNWRYSETFSPDFEVESVSWESEFSVPYKHPMVRKYNG